jgi:hypothetical protein
MLPNHANCCLVHTARHLIFGEDGLVLVAGLHKEFRGPGVSIDDGDNLHDFRTAFFGGFVRFQDRLSR